MGRRALFPTFWTHFVKVEATGCWEWAGQRNDAGYGLVRDPRTGRNRYVHRVAYELHHGVDPLPSSVLVRHAVCDNPPCGNPEHLARGTASDNHHDAMAKGRHTRGEKRPNAVLTEREVAGLRSLLAEGYPAHVLARAVLADIGDIARGRAWAHVTAGPVPADLRARVVALGAACACGCGRFVRKDNGSGYAHRCPNRPAAHEPKSRVGRGKPLAPDERARARALAAEGATAKTIATVLGRSYHAVRNLLRNSEE